MTDIKEPIFDKTFKAYLDSDTMSEQISSSDTSMKRKNEKKPKI